MYVYGKNVAKETLNSNSLIKSIILNEDFHDEDILNMIKEKNISVKVLNKKEFQRLDSNNNQGIILEVEDYKYFDIADLLTEENPFIVILDHIEDPHNFGAIIRTCEAAGVTGIIISKDRCVRVNATVMKTSAGALNNVKICMVTNINDTIKKLKKKGIWIIGTDMTNSVCYTKVDYNIPLALVIGSEGFGMSRLIRESCDYIVNIPMNGKVNSLNASVAAAILIYKVIEVRGNNV